MNKKGDVSDMLIFIITLFVLAVGFFILIYINPSIIAGLRTAGLNNSQTGADAIDSLETTIPSVINYGFMFLFVGLVISLMITSFMIKQHPIFMILYIFFLAVTILLGVYLSNTYYYSIETNPIFASTTDQASFINLIMNYAVEIAVSVGALSMVIVFSKFNPFGGQQF